jgi:hypothetical protein
MRDSFWVPCVINVMVKNEKIIMKIFLLQQHDDVH